MNSSDVGLQSNRSGKLPGGSTGKGFRPGQSGNPSGKRKGSVSLAARILSEGFSRGADRGRATRKIESAVGGETFGPAESGWGVVWIVKRGRVTIRREGLPSVGKPLLARPGGERLRWNL
jgi:hypothetical protein